jgi:hypothetical protein
MMAFLHRLLARCGSWLARRLKSSTSGEDIPSTPRELSTGEVVSRLLYTKNHFSRPRNRPKPAAFDPSPYNELSTIHITGLSHEAIWGIAVNALGDQPGRDQIHARADVPVDELLERKLRAVRDDDPFARHTLVLGWPQPDDPSQRKEQWKEICLALSQCPRVELVIPPTPIARAAGDA